MRKVAELVFNPGLLTRLLGAPPGTPQDRVEALRKAFMENMKDPATAAVGARAHMRLTPLSGEEGTKMIAGF